MLVHHLLILIGRQNEKRHPVIHLPSTIASFGTKPVQQRRSRSIEPWRVAYSEDSIFACTRLMDERRCVKLSWHMLRIAVRDRVHTLFGIHRAIEIGNLLWLR
jgi:hypothetical protein